jgi:hypothetical protein
MLAHRGKYGFAQAATFDDEAIVLAKARPWR